MSDEAAITRKEKREKKSAERYAATHQPDIHRQMPQAPDAEKGLLASYLIDPVGTQALYQERGLVVDWFYLESNQLIFAALECLHRERTGIDIISLTNLLRDCNHLDECGGPGPVSELFTYLPTAANAAHYLEIVAKKYAARRLISVCTEMAGRGFDEQGEIGDVIDEAQAAILAVNRPDSTGTETIQHIKPFVFEAINVIEETYANRGACVGLETGIHALDRMTGGLRPGELWIIAGRPSMGKTALAMNIAEHVAIICGKPVLIFSVEMPSLDLVTRMLLGRAQINLQTVRDGFLSKIQIERDIPTASLKIAAAPIHIDDTPGLSIQELRVRARRFKRLHPNCAAIFVDYLQFLKSNTKRAKDNRALEIGEISYGLKMLGRELGLPMVVAAQINRNDDGANSPPKLSNLRESGNIEQDADGVVLLHRRHYYTKEDDDKDQATADVAKQRNGPTGAFPLKFATAYARFENPEGSKMYSNNPAHRQSSLLAEADGD